MAERAVRFRLGLPSFAVQETRRAKADEITGGGKEFVAMSSSDLGCGPFKADTRV